jgi:protein-S-isoprenylcysteine O-methyltransferase Ste14
MDRIEIVAYYAALVTVVCVPPGISLWFLIHPFARLWRKVGPVSTYLLVMPVLLSTGIAIYRIRETLLGIRFGVSMPLTAISAVFFLMGLYFGIRRTRHLTPSVMLGVPEVSRAKGPGKLLTGGIYGQVRHPRYLEIRISPVRALPDTP